MTYRIMISEMADAYQKIDSVVTGGEVTGGGYNYSPKEFIESGDFEGTVSSWNFWESNDHQIEADSINEANIDYTEAHSGSSCVEVVIYQYADAFSINLAGSTNNMADLQGKNLTFSVWVKNASASNFGFYIDAHDGDTTTAYTGDALPTFAVSSTWTQYTFSRTYVFGRNAEYFVVGIKKASGTGSILIDDFSLTVLTDNEFVANGSFETNTTGWALRNSSFALDSNPDNSITRVNTYAAPGGGSWSLKFTTGNTGNYGVYHSLYSALSSGNALHMARFEASIWVKTALANYTARIYMNGDFEVDEGESVAYIVGDNAWHQYAITARYDITTVSEILIGVRQDGSAMGDVYIDLVSFRITKEMGEDIESTYIDLEPPMDTGYAASLVGKRLVFTNVNNATNDPQNKDFGSIITDVAYSGTEVSQITVAEALPYEPDEDDTFVILYPNTNRYATEGSTNLVMMVQDYVSGDVIINSTVDDGYSTASIDLASTILRTPLFKNNPIGFKVQIAGDWGNLWEGFMASYSITGSSVKVECQGFGVKLNDVRYTAYFDTDEQNTVPVIVKDILSAHPEIEYYDTTIDRDDVIHDAQVIAGGAGPLDFTEGATTAAEALDRVLRIGTLGEETYDQLALQVWDNQTAWLVRVKQDIDVDDAKWFLWNANTRKSGIEVSIGVDRADRGNVYYGTYSGDGGEQLETVGIYDISDVARFGIAEKQTSTSTLTEGEVYWALRTQANDKGKESSVSDISVNGYISATGYGMAVPCYTIRAGDVIFISDAVKYENGMIGGDGKAQLIIAGEVTSTLNDMTTRITPYKVTSKIESLVGWLEVNVG
jgi:hypothetical protein